MMMTEIFEQIEKILEPYEIPDREIYNDTEVQFYLMLDDNDIIAVQDGIIHGDCATLKPTMITEIYISYLIKSNLYESELMKDENLMLELSLFLEKNFKFIQLLTFK